MRVFLAALVGVFLAMPLAAQVPTVPGMPLQAPATEESEQPDTPDTGETRDLADVVAAEEATAGAEDNAAPVETTETELIDNLQVLVGERIDLQSWLKLANRAEHVIDRNQASSAAIEDLRAQLVDYRNQFIDIRDSDSARIRTLRAQIARLGPVPETGEEPKTLSLTRASLTNRLDQLLAPVIAAEAAFGLTDGLIAEIDALQRTRQAETFVERGPSALNPALWPAALSDLHSFALSLKGEMVDAFTSRNGLAAARQRALRISLMLLVGFYFLLRGRGLARQLGSYMRRFGGRGSGVWEFVISLGRIAIPYAGIVLIVNALRLSDLSGLRADVLLEQVPVWAMTLLTVTWLRDRLFSPSAMEEGNSLVSAERVSSVLTMITLLAVMLVLAHACATIIEMERMEPETAAVLQFPIFVLSGLFLYRLASILGRGVAEQKTDAETEPVPAPKSGYGPLLPGLCWTARAVAIAAPVAAGFGYSQAAAQLLYPMVWTLALFGAVVAFHTFITKFYAWASGRGNKASESLIPALAGVLLVLFVLPIVAVAWGVRPSDLFELWTRFLEGVEVGSTRVSPLDFLAFVVIFGLCYIATRLLQGALRTNLLPKTNMDVGGQTAIVSGTGYVGIFLAALIAISSTGLDLSSLAIVAGALSVGIGFGLQTVVSNFVSGIILLIERPVSEGDWIQVGEHGGIVKNISVRATRIETFDRMDVIVPNSDLISGAVSNYTRNPVGRVILPVGVAYGTDTRKVADILKEVADAHPMALATPAPFILFKGFGADSLDFEVRVIIRDVNWGLTVRSELNHAIAERFVAEGIEIPFAQRDIWLRNPEALTQPNVAKATSES